MRKCRKKKDSDDSVIWKILFMKDLGTVPWMINYFEELFMNMSMDDLEDIVYDGLIKTHRFDFQY
jgi:hypothetical protein